MKASREKRQIVPAKKKESAICGESEQSGRGKSKEVGGKPGSRQGNPLLYVIGNLGPAHVCSLVVSSMSGSSHGSIILPVPSPSAPSFLPLILS